MEKNNVNDAALVHSTGVFIADFESISRITLVRKFFNSCTNVTDIHLENIFTPDKLILRF